MTYDQTFFRQRAARVDHDARAMVPDVSCAIGKCPASVIDFGCGDGAMLRWWREMGAQSLIGVDLHGPDDWTKATGGLHARLDLTQPIDLGVSADLVVCLEVAEHLPDSAAETLVETLCRHGRRILFSAAPPGQGGTDHLNEQPLSYWGDLFIKHGYAYQDIVRHRLHPSISPWYRENIVLFCKHSHRVEVPRVKVCTAAYRDCFWDVQDAITDLTKSSLLPELYGAHPFSLHQLSHDAMVAKMRSKIADETVTKPEWQEFEYSLWIDADSIFRPQQAIDLVMATHANGWEIGTGIYTTKQPKARIVHRIDGPPRPMPLGPYAHPYTVSGCGFGFVVTRNDLFRRMAADSRAGIERVWLEEGVFIFDFFRETIGAARYDWLDPLTGRLCAPWWSEDTSFCEKATACDALVWVQPQIAIKHRGRFDFSIANLNTEGAAE